MSGEKDAQTLFHRVLPATARDLTSTIAVDWYLKVKDIEYGVGLTENYCITVGMQTKISSILNFFQQILGSHVLKAHPKIIEIIFSFPEFPPACKKSVHSINSFFRYSQF